MGRWTLMCAIALSRVSFISFPSDKASDSAGGSSSRVDHVIGHWTVSGLVTLSSGTWYTVTDGNGNFANSDGQQRPDFVPGQKATGKPCVAGTFFNTCAFRTRRWDLSAT
jgi:hypothetical protein